MNRYTILVIAFLAVGGALIAARFFVPETSQQGAKLDNAAEIEALLRDLPMITYGESTNGVTVRRSDTGATFEMPTGRKAEVSTPTGYALESRFLILGEIAGGFLLRDIDGENEGDQTYFNFIVAPNRLEPTSNAAAEYTYNQAAEQVRAEGQVPFFEETAPVSNVVATDDGVYLCVTAPDGGIFQYAVRFVANLSVTAMSAGQCSDDLSLLRGRLDLAEEALAGNR